MNKMYCFSCGGMISYGAAKPSFCSLCGTPLVKGVVRKNPPDEMAEEALGDEEDTHWSLGQFSQEGLEVEISNNNVETFGQMASVDYGDVGGLEPLGRRPPPKKTKKQNLEEFQREAGMKVKGKPPVKRTRKRKPKKT